MKLNDIQKLITAAIVKIQDKELLKDIGEEIKEDVVKRTRLGRGVMKSEGPSHTLKPLEEKTKYNRRGLKKKGELTGEGAQPAKSGLNSSGDMLNSLDVTSKDSSFTLTLDSKGSQTAENVKKIDSRFTFMNLSKAEVTRIIRLMEEQVKKVLKSKS